MTNATVPPLTKPVPVDKATLLEVTAPLREGIATLKTHLGEANHRDFVSELAREAGLPDGRSWKRAAKRARLAAFVGIIGMGMCAGIMFVQMHETNVARTEVEQLRRNSGLADCQRELVRASHSATEAAEAAQQANGFVRQMRQDLIRAEESVRIARQNAAVAQSSASISSTRAAQASRNAESVIGGSLETQSPVDQEALRLTHIAIFGRSPGEVQFTIANVLTIQDWVITHIQNEEHLPIAARHASETLSRQNGDCDDQTRLFLQLVALLAPDKVRMIQTSVPIDGYDYHDLVAHAYGQVLIGSIQSDAEYQEIIDELRTQLLSRFGSRISTSDPNGAVDRLIERGLSIERNGDRSELWFTLDTTLGPGYVSCPIHQPGCQPSRIIYLDRRVLHYISTNRDIDSGVDAGFDGN